MKYPIEKTVTKDGYSRWITPAKTYRMACCDCGLVHNLQFRFNEGSVEFRASRNNRATGQLRRHRT